MSTPETASIPNETQFVSQDESFGEFDYKPIPMTAAVALATAIFSLSAFLALIGIAIAFIGIVIGFLALRTIKRSDGEYGGIGLAKMGFYGSVACFFLGISSHAYAYVTELPEGHVRVHFSADISAKQFTMDKQGNRTIPRSVRENYVDKKIFIKGYMWNTITGNDLSSFVLLKDNGKCCFGGDPAAYDNMVVEMQNGMTIDYREGLVALAGVLRANPQAAEGQPVYKLEATQFGRAKTSFGSE